MKIATEFRNMVPVSFFSISLYYVVFPWVFENWQNFGGFFSLTRLFFILIWCWNRVIFKRRLSTSDGQNDVMAIKEGQIRLVGGRDDTEVSYRRMNARGYTFDWPRFPMSWEKRFLPSKQHFWWLFQLVSFLKKTSWFPGVLIGWPTDFLYHGLKLVKVLRQNKPLIDYKYISCLQQWYYGKQLIPLWRGFFYRIVDQPVF